MSGISNNTPIPPGYIKPYINYDAYFQTGPPENKRHTDSFEIGPYEGIIINVLIQQESSEIFICHHDGSHYEEVEVYSIDDLEQPLKHLGSSKKNGYYVRANGNAPLIIKFPGGGNFIRYTPPALWLKPLPLEFYIDMLTPEHVRKEQARLVKDFPDALDCVMASYNT